MSLKAFYVLISRVRTSDSLRLLQVDREALDAVRALKHDELLGAWEGGYDQQSGKWSDDLAVAALARVRRERKAAKDARAAAKQEETPAGRRASSSFALSPTPRPIAQITFRV